MPEPPANSAVPVPTSGIVRQAFDEAWKRVRGLTPSSEIRRRTLRAARDEGTAWSDFTIMAGNARDDDVHSDRVLRRRFRHLSVRASVIDIRRETRMEYVVVPFAVLAVFVPLGFAIRYATDVVNGIAFSFVAVLGCLACLFTMSAGLGKRVFRTLGLAVAWTATGVTTWQLERANPEFRGILHERVVVSRLATAWGDGLILGVLVALIALVGIFVAVATTAVGERHDLEKWPDAAIFEAFVAILSAMKRQPLTRLSEKGALAYGLERAASITENQLFRALRVPSYADNADLRAQVQDVAAFIRSCQTQLVFPTYLSHRELATTSVDVVRCLCAGAFGSLPSLARTDAQKKGRRVHAMLNLLRSLFIGLLPIAVVIVLRRERVLSGDDFEHTLVVAAVIWALVCVVVAIDPHFADRLRITKDVIATLRGSGSKSG